MKAHSATHQHNKKSIFQYLPGPIKIKDGLFLGDQIAARDIEFIISNKVTHIINTVSRQIPNLWERFGTHYLSVNWTQKQQNIFDKKNNAVNTIFHFIQQAMNQGQSCLIHSVNGKSRSSAVLVAYLMKKYSWSLTKCLQFIASKKQNLQIRHGFLLQMQQLQQRMNQTYNLSTEWVQSKNEQQLVLKNTLINSKSINLDPQQKNIQKKNKKKVSWNQKPTIIQKSFKSTMLNFKQSIKTTQTTLKSILKTDQQLQQNLPIAQSQEKNNYLQFQQIKSKIPNTDGNYINNINGNIVHVTVNNFITPDKKSQIQGKNSVNTRPYSSDQKDRDKQKKINNQKKIIPYDTHTLLSFKSPYDTKLVGIRTASHFKQVKKQQKQWQNKNANPTLPYQRPQSAKSRSTGYANRFKQQLIVTNGISNALNLNKKRFPSNPKDQLFRKR